MGGNVIEKENGIINGCCMFGILGWGYIRICYRAGSLSYM